MKTDKIRRLSALKMEHVNQLRQDINQLDQLVSESHEQYESALTDIHEFSENIARDESSSRLLSAAEMMERRRYLANLCLKKDRKKKVVDEVEKQHEYALSNLKNAYMELKALDLLAERKMAMQLVHDTRKEYSMADDEQTVRHVLE